MTLDKSIQPWISYLDINGVAAHVWGRLDKEYPGVLYIIFPTFWECPTISKENLNMIN